MMIWLQHLNQPERYAAFVNISHTLLIIIFTFCVYTLVGLSYKLLSVWLTRVPQARKGMRVREAFPVTMALLAHLVYLAHQDHL